MNRLRVNRTKVQAKNRACARCAQPFSVPPSEHDTTPQKESRHERLFWTHRPIAATLSHEEDLIMNDELLTMVEREVLSWPGATSEPGRFGARDSDHTVILQPAGETTTKGGN